MERTKVGNKQIQTLSQLVSRMTLAAQLGQQQYGGDRNIYEALGYKTDITYKDYLARYTRQDIAKAIIDRPVKATWQGDVELIETNDEKRTPFEKAWKDINKELGLKNKLSRSDRLTGIGNYSILLLGLDDVKSQEDFEKPVKSGKRSLLYVKPFGQNSASVLKYEEDTKNSRYGLPDIYQIETENLTTRVDTAIKIHYSRVIHIIDDILESEVEGAPRLEAVFNRLMDLEKIVGGDGEMFWRGARPGYHGKIDPNYQMTNTTKDDLKDQIDEFEHNMRRILINEGIDLEALTQQIADPAGHVNVQIMMISAVTGIPQRILTGSERGELASSEDRGEWMAYVQSRREDHAEPHILRPVIDRFIELKILPKPKDGYSVKWADLFSQSEKARVEIGKSRATALREYTLNPMAEAIVPPTTFMEFFLGLTSDQIELINKMRSAEISEEELTAAIIKRMEAEEESKVKETEKTEKVVKEKVEV